MWHPNKSEWGFLHKFCVTDGDADARANSSEKCRPQPYGGGGLTYKLIC